MSLDKENENVGYRLGRLFATLEQCQKKAQPGGKDMKTIRDRFYSSASSSPVSVFANLMRLNKHHLSKLSVGWGQFFSTLIGEIVYQDKDKSGIKVFPAHLSLEDQGMFAIGYYHQAQDFFTKKTDKTNE
jgi:CRISPR-associated protein Csd1